MQAACRIRCKRGKARLRQANDEVESEIAGSSAAGVCVRTGAGWSLSVQIGRIPLIPNPQRFALQLSFSVSVVAKAENKWLGSLDVGFFRSNRFPTYVGQ